MKPLILTITLLTAGFSGGAFACADILKVSQQKLNSTESIDFCQAFEGKTLLVVNTASQCGFTPQYKQLEALYQKYKQQGLVVVGFPSNDFNQDRGGEENTAKVCYLDYGVTFPMVARTSIKGKNANPVFSKIAKQSGVSPRWNFYKFLIDKDGEVVATFPSSVSPTSGTLTDVIEQHL
ncbi:glutathione peroxidase [Vibrio ishigakensis]|uniref:Glutathione peroxidase n=1 Tax=Vibrio ishigakensis TaxID=1481914 RepID=A0A0B8NXJ9_9VIBR|nr:glutathione peroxidase [Vibrio ishigakensis]GAM57017.1 glutathione peroxidase [Vibrio ishigakensis]